MVSQDRSKIWHSGDVEALSYADAKDLCKHNRLSVKGTTAVLKQRIADHLGIHLPPDDEALEDTSGRAHAFGSPYQGRESNQSLGPAKATRSSMRVREQLQTASRPKTPPMTPPQMTRSTAYCTPEATSAEKQTQAIARRKISAANASPLPNIWPTPGHASSSRQEPLEDDSPDTPHEGGAGALSTVIFLFLLLLVSVFLGLCASFLSGTNWKELQAEAAAGRFLPNLQTQTQNLASSHYHSLQASTHWLQQNIGSSPDYMKSLASTATTRATEKVRAVVRLTQTTARTAKASVQEFVREIVAPEPCQPAPQGVHLPVELLAQVFDNSAMPSVLMGIQEDAASLTTERARSVLVLYTARPNYGPAIAAGEMLEKLGCNGGTLKGKCLLIDASELSGKGGDTGGLLQDQFAQQLKRHPDSIIALAGHHLLDPSGLIVLLHVMSEYGMLNTVSHDGKPVCAVKCNAATLFIMVPPHKGIKDPHVAFNASILSSLGNDADATLPVALERRLAPGFLPYKTDSTKRAEAKDIRESESAQAAVEAAEKQAAAILAEKEAAASVYKVQEQDDDEDKNGDMIEGDHHTEL